MAGVDSQWPNEHTEGVALPRSKKLNPKPFKERSQENETLRKTNPKIAASSLFGALFLSYLPKEHIYQFYRALYGDAMLVFLGWPLLNRTARPQFEIKALSFCS